MKPFYHILFYLIISAPFASAQTVIKDSSLHKPGATKNEVVPDKFDKRWYISPLLKFQSQDFGMLEKQRMNYLSDADKVSFIRKSNNSAAVSIYKNLTGRLSGSVDIGMSVGHISSKDSLISRTQKQTYNVFNATAYYHLLGAKYRLQPFLAAGFNNVINDASYMSLPLGGGVKYTGKNIMMEAQMAFGYAITKNIANTMIYSVGLYIPIKNKADRKRKDNENTLNPDTARSSNITNITNNYYYYNSDSSKRLKTDPDQNEAVDKNTNGDELNDNDAPENLRNGERFVVYFEYNQYMLMSGAFNVIDGVIGKMKMNNSLNVHVKGHTDLTGSEKYNVGLSMKRANMILEYMNSRGISSDRIILSSYGKAAPVIKSEEQHTAWQNRRCEIILHDTK